MYWLLFASLEHISGFCNSNTTERIVAESCTWLILQRLWFSDKLIIVGHSKLHMLDYYICKENWWINKWGDKYINIKYYL